MISRISMISMICIICMITLVLAYSTYGAPSEFGNESTTTCWVGGDEGIINCTGNITATYFCNSLGVCWDDSAGNSTFNQSLTDILYAGIEWDYNQSLASYNSWNDIWTSTYNSTYDTWSYNQSQATFEMWNDTWATNEGTGNLSWNQSLADTLYADISVTGDNGTWNQSLADLLYSEIEWNYNQSLATFNMWNSIWTSTYNATYNLWAYNQTTPSINYTNTVIESNNLSWLSTYNATYDAKLDSMNYTNIVMENESNVVTNDFELEDVSLSIKVYFDNGTLVVEG